MQNKAKKFEIQPKVLLSLAIVTLVFIIPKVLKSDYWLHVIIEVGIFSITAIGLRILMQVGAVSFAQASFMMLGGYISALLVMKLGMNFWCALFLAATASTIIGSILGWPALRLKADYFFLVSFCMGEVIRLFFNFVWKDLFGGPSGITYIPPPDPIFGIEFFSKISFYYLVIVFLALASIMSWSINKSRIGTIFTSIKDKDGLAGSLGINVIKYKVIAFAISCFLASIAGSLYAHYHTCIDPTCFTVTQSVSILAYTVVGGTGSWIGPIIGTFFLKVLGELVRPFGHYEVISAGIALIVVVIILPNGFVGIPSYFKSVKGSQRNEI